MPVLEVATTIPAGPETIPIDEELTLQLRTGWPHSSNFDLFYQIQRQEIKVGNVSFYGRRGDIAKMAYGIEPAAQRQRVATRAATRLRDFGFEEWGLSKIVLDIAFGNHPSKGVASSLGARLLDGFMPGYASAANYETWLVEKDAAHA